MSTRGETTRRRLIEATTALVRELGYAKVTTRSIATAAEVAEGTLYRHFPDKASLFLAAVLEKNAPIVAASATLPAQAGIGTVAANLVTACRIIAELQDDIVPFEFAMFADPSLMPSERAGERAKELARRPGPPQHIAQYLAAEQALGRVRPECDPEMAAIAILSLLFGLGINPVSRGKVATSPLLEASIRMFVGGLESR
ncbi:MAG: TetR/AcrR family transcriptional regulator [Rhodoglobus sp.]